MTDRFDAVVFDWYATLGAPAEHDWWQQMFEMIELAGGSTPDDARSNWANPATEHPEHSGDEESYRDYEARLLHDLLAASQLPDGTKGELLESILRMRDQESIAIYPDVRALLMDLKAAGTTVALCSNWSWDLDRHLYFNEIESLFDTVICSAIVGYRKPHPEIFNALLAELKLPPERVAFVGDDWIADIQGATAAGLVPFHLARRGCPELQHDLAPCAGDLDALRVHLLG